MQNKLWTVLKIQFLNQSGLNQLRYEHDRRKRGRAIGTLIGIILIAIVLIGASFAVGFGYGLFGLVEVIPSFAFAIVSMITLFFSFIKVNGYLFAFRDYDMLMSLPVSEHTIISSKFLYMYLNNLLFSLGVMLPMGSAYLICNGSLSAAGRGVVGLMWIVAAVLTPLIPMAVAGIVGTIVAAIGSKSRFKVLIQVVLMLLFMCLMIAFNIFMNTVENEEEMIQAMEKIADMMQKQMHRIYPVSVLFDTAVNKQRILPFLGFVLLSFGIYFLFMVLVAKKYRAINTALMSRRKGTAYKMKKQKRHSVITALVYKEWRRLLSSAPYLINLGLGMMLVVIASVLCLVAGRDLLERNADLQKVIRICRYSVPFVALMFLTMSCTTSVSLSLEGKNLWILQSLPISWKTILKGKMAFNMVLLLPAAFLCSLCLGITLQLDVLTLLLYFVVSFAMVSFSTVIGMWFNLCFQKYQWENEMEVVKQGASVALGILVNMFLQMILIFVSMFLSFIIDGRIVLTGISVFFCLLSGIIYQALLSGEKSRINPLD